MTKTFNITQLADWDGVTSYPHCGITPLEPRAFPVEFETAPIVTFNAYSLGNTSCYGVARHVTSQEPDRKRTETPAIYIVPVTARTDIDMFDVAVDFYVIGIESRGGITGIN